MTIPETAAQFIALIVIALPGIVFASARTRARGLVAADVNLSSRIVQGLVAGVILDAAYLMLFGERLVEAFTLVDGQVPSIRPAAAYTLGLGVLLPAALAWLIYGRLRWSLPKSGRLATGGKLVADRWAAVREGFAVRVGKFRADRRFSRTPTAWDFALPMSGRHFVRIETAEGKFLGGWFAEGSFISTYPEPHDIYVERQYRMSKDGEFLDMVADTGGFWYSVRPGDTIDWIDPSEPEAKVGNTNGI